MSGKNDLACGGLAGNRTVYQPDNAAVRLVAGSGKDRNVTWIGRPTAGPDDVVPGRPQHVCRLS